MAALLVDHDGRTVRIEPDEVLTFGRSGDLAIDPGNRYLHRVLGCFAARDGVWFLQHMGRHTPMQVLDQADGSCVEVEPGAQSPIPFEAFSVAFSAGGSAYEIRAARALD